MTQKVLDSNLEKYVAMVNLFISENYGELIVKAKKEKTTCKKKLDSSAKKCT
ncbi:MAG: hypothetical protein ACR5KV_04910 [Wolbachia sp.]